jgi:hypothetical protein
MKGCTCICKQTWWDWILSESIRLQYMCIIGCCLFWGLCFIVIYDCMWLWTTKRIKVFEFQGNDGNLGDSSRFHKAQWKSKVAHDKWKVYFAVENNYGRQDQIIPLKLNTFFFWPSWIIISIHLRDIKSLLSSMIAYLHWALDSTEMWWFCHLRKIKTSWATWLSQPWVMNVSTNCFIGFKIAKLQFWIRFPHHMVTLVFLNSVHI